MCKRYHHILVLMKCLDGRVKTLHPKIHAGILHDRGNKKHKLEMNKRKFPSIDLIIVNFYPFQKIVLNSKKPKRDN